MTKSRVTCFLQDKSNCVKHDGGFPCSDFQSDLHTPNIILRFHFAVICCHQHHQYKYDVSIYTN